MPLTPMQRVVVQTLRPFRTQLNYVGGGAALNQQWPRLSDDMDIFRDFRGHLPNSVDPELKALEDAGFSVELTTRDEWMVEALVRRFGHETKVQWLEDRETSKRFFAAVADDELGFRLHQADAAVNKVLCAARRAGAPRDAVDLVNVVRRYAPLGPLIWALSGKDAALNPTRVIRDIRRIAFGYGEEEIRAVRMEGDGTLAQAELRAVLEPALDQAAQYCEDTAPLDYAGHLLVNQSEIPILATAEDVDGGRAAAIEVKDFTVLPKLG
jgi:hypothetical protein